MNENHHLNFMTRALELAKQGRYSVSPNPMVGCVIVNKNTVIGTGYHQKAGEAHAEIKALVEAGQQAKDATLYTTLEPCCHYGRTPPCTDAIIRSGIKEVYVASVDKNPNVEGKGIEKLRAAGIHVHVGLCAEVADELNEIFFHYIQHKRPFVIAKWAMSLDGKMQVNHDDDKKISNKESSYSTHELRQAVDAILIGANTLRDDNPQLTVRYASTVINHPLRIVLAGKNPLPTNALIFNPNLPGKTMVATTNENQLPNLQNIEILQLPADENNGVSLLALLNELGKREMTSLLVEGGRKVHESFVRAELVDKIHVYLAPTLIANLPNKQSLTISELKQLGDNFHFTAQICGDNHV